MTSSNLLAENRSEFAYGASQEVEVSVLEVRSADRGGCVVIKARNDRGTLLLRIPPVRAQVLERRGTLDYIERHKPHLSVRGYFKKAKWITPKGVTAFAWEIKTINLKILGKDGRVILNAGFPTDLEEIPAT